MTSNKDESEIIEATGIIPDFFHDIIAYFTPGFTFLVILYLDFNLSLDSINIKFKEISYFSIFLFFVIAYVIGKLIESAGYILIHNQSNITERVYSKPKWFLVFKKNKHYTESFRLNLKNKIANHLKKQDGCFLIQSCEEDKKDDYFNLIQFYLRERFPAVAYYEKKQNATIVLNRSLSLIFLSNSYFLLVALLLKKYAVGNQLQYLIWLFIQPIAAWLFFRRFLLDKVYHAMYIFESFIATQKLLKRNRDQNIA